MNESDCIRLYDSDINAIIAIIALFAIGGGVIAGVSSVGLHQFLNLPIWANFVDPTDLSLYYYYYYYYYLPLD